MNGSIDRRRLVAFKLTMSVNLEGDSVFAIAVVSSLCKQPNLAHPIFHDIHYWILNCDHFYTNHVYREANHTARLIAKYALHSKCSWSNHVVIPNDLFSKSYRLIGRGPNTRGNDHRASSRVLSCWFLASLHNSKICAMVMYCYFDPAGGFSGSCLWSALAGVGWFFR